MSTNNNLNINNSNITNNTLFLATSCKNSNDQSQKQDSAVCDSAASNHYFREQDVWILKDLEQTPTSNITIPDGTDITSNKKEPFRSILPLVYTLVIHQLFQS